jgi:hypothetical protein
VRDDGELIASTGKARERERSGGEHPHRNTKLLECMLDGGKRQSGGVASGRSTAMAAPEDLDALGFFRRNDGCSLGEKLGHRGALK